MNQAAFTAEYFGHYLAEDPPCVHCGGAGGPRGHHLVEREVHVDRVDADGHHYTEAEVVEDTCPGQAEDEAAEAKMLAAIANPAPMLEVF